MLQFVGSLLQATSCNMAQFYREAVVYHKERWATRWGALIRAVRYRPTSVRVCEKILYASPPLHRRSVGRMAPSSEAHSSTDQFMYSAMRGAQSSIISSIVVSYV